MSRNRKASQAGLDKIRKELSDLSEARAHAESAPLTLAEVEPRVREQIERRLAHATRNLEAQIVRPTRDFAPPALEIDAELVVAVAIGAETLFQQCMAHLERTADGGLSSEQRAQRLAEIDARREELELLEEIEILGLEAAGAPVLRRPDLNADLVLNVWSEHGKGDG